MRRKVGATAPPNDGTGCEISKASNSSDSSVVQPGEELISASDATAATVRALSRALELRDYRRGEFAETRDHCDRVTRVALRLAEAVAPELLRDPQLEYGFRLHDIGMLAISDTILLKQGPLDERELDEIREHPWLGERIVASAPYLNGLARQVIGSHHEKWDGSGYPRRLVGEEIPLAARIFALADAFDAITSDQPYRRALPFDFALAEIEDKAGSHFDPAPSAAFLSIADDLRPALAAVETV